MKSDQIIGIPNQVHFPTIFSFTFSECGMLVAIFAIVLGATISLCCWSRKNRAAGITSSHLAVLAALIGAIVGLTGALLSNHDPLIDFIAACTASIFVVQIGEILRHHNLSKKRHSLERALNSDVTFKRIETLLESLDAIQVVKERHPDLKIFIDEAAENIFNQIDDVLDLLSRGSIRIDEEARELTANRDFLQKLPRKTVQAVSYQDETFWDDPEGKDFLSAHAAKIAEGVTIQRIFILKESAIATQRAVIEEQQRLHVVCYIIEEEKLSSGNLPPEDFVIYDDIYVRFAELVGVGPTTTLKHATLTCESDRVRQYLLKWNYLKTRSKPATQVYTPTPGGVSTALDNPKLADTSLSKPAEVSIQPKLDLPASSRPS